MNNNIYVRNQLGSKSGARSKLSAKSTVKRNKNIKEVSKISLKTSSSVNKTLSHMSSGNSSNVISSTLGKASITTAVIGASIAIAEKTVSFGIDLKEAETGDRVSANNARATLKTVVSLGQNYIFGAIHNELFTKRVISRQNYGLDYYRELYQLNMEGKKNKRI